MPVSKEEFRGALGCFAATVTVVTSKYADGRFGGITVTAFSSVSLEPPLVSICIDRRARLHDVLVEGHWFAVNLLAADQEAVSRRFASSQGDPFSELGYQLGAGGCPLLDGAMATVECQITQTVAAGDHTLIVGQIEAAAVAALDPLLYYRGKYRSLG